MAYPVKYNTGQISLNEACNYYSFSSKKLSSFGSSPTYRSVSAGSNFSLSKLYTLEYYYTTGTITTTTYTQKRNFQVSRYASGTLFDTQNSDIRINLNFSYAASVGGVGDTYVYVKYSRNGGSYITLFSKSDNWGGGGTYYSGNLSITNVANTDTISIEIYCESSNGTGADLTLTMNNITFNSNGLPITRTKYSLRGTPYSYNVSR